MGIFGPNIRKMKENHDIDGLIKALKHSDTVVRMDAAIALGEIRNIRAVEPLIDALKDTEIVRWEAVWALGEIGDKRAVGPLINLLKDSDTNVRWDAAESLRKIRDPRGLDALKKFEGPRKKKEIHRFEEEIKDLQKKVQNIFIDDIKALLSKNKLDDANKLLSERKSDYTRFLELNKEMKDIDIKLAKLSSKLLKLSLIFLTTF